MGKEDFHREGLPAHRKELGLASLNGSFSQQRDKWRGQHFRPDSSASSGCRVSRSATSVQQIVPFYNDLLDLGS